MKNSRKKIKCTVSLYSFNMSFKFCNNLHMFNAITTSDFAILVSGVHSLDMMTFSFKLLLQLLPAGPLVKYRSLVKQGKLQYDPYQEEVAVKLDNLLGRLEQYEKDMQEYHVGDPRKR